AYNPAPAGAGNTTSGLNGCTSSGTTSTNPYYPGGTSYGMGDVGALNPGTCTGPCYPAWPFFTPDGKGVIFELTSEPDFVSAMPGRDTPAKSELWYVDVATKKAVKLQSIAPLNPADDLLDYYPTVMPVAVGGKFWLFWTSRRQVGHR